MGTMRAPRAREHPMNRDRFVAANWRSPLMFAALAKVPLQASSLWVASLVRLCQLRKLSHGLIHAR
jgi:hypothetical protein